MAVSLSTYVLRAASTEYGNSAWFANPMIPADGHSRAAVVEELLFLRREFGLLEAAKTA
jgi:hypothetical protein